MANAVKTIGVLTSGGDAPGMNAATRAVVRTALAKGINVKGILKGYNGLLNEEIIDMDATSVSDTIDRGGTILYTARCLEFVDPEYQKKGADICKKHGIDGLVVIEGIRMFVEIPKDRIVKIYASESFAYDNKEMLCDYRYEIVADNVFCLFSYSQLSFR